MIMRLNVPIDTDNLLIISYASSPLSFLVVFFLITFVPMFQAHIQHRMVFYASSLLHAAYHHRHKAA